MSLTGGFSCTHGDADWSGQFAPNSSSTLEKPNRSDSGACSKPPTPASSSCPRTNRPPPTQVPQRRGTTSDDRRTRPMPACLPACAATNDETYSAALATAPDLSAKQAMTRCVLRRGPPALHCTPLTAAGSQCCTTPCLASALRARPRRGAEGIEGQASVSPLLTHVRAGPCQLPRMMPARRPTMPGPRQRPPERREATLCIS
jgi:hypothetical protein